MAESQAVALRPHSSTDLEALSEFDEILLGLREAPDVQDDPAAISNEIIAQLLTATSDEQLAIGKAIGWQSLEGVPVEIRGFRWRKSDFEDGSPLYVLVQGVDLTTGEFHPAITCGSKNVLAILSNLARRGQLPGAVWKLVKAEKPTEGGFYPLWLEKIPAEIVESHRAALSNPLLEDDEA